MDFYICLYRGCEVLIVGTLFLEVPWENRTLTGVPTEVYIGQIQTLQILETDQILCLTKVKKIGVCQMNFLFKWKNKNDYLNQFYNQNHYPKENLEKKTNI